ncbi:MAG: ABC transporter, partial [Clostridia bacterium]|nr:ABC transporter [Clostridia bacterium]
MSAIYKKEMRTYFTTPLGYVFIAVFLAVSGFVFAFSTFQTQTSDISGYFQLMIFGYIVIVPLLTMRSFAEERRTRTEQLLLTSPVS